MPVTDNIRNSRTPAQAIKQPSADLYHAQGINPQEQIHPSADQYVARNYGSNDLPPTTRHSFNQPEQFKTNRNQSDMPSEMQNTYGNQHSAAANHPQYGMTSAMPNQATEPEMSDRFIYNAPPKPEVGRQHAHGTQHPSGDPSPVVPSTHQLVSTLEKGQRVLEHRKNDTKNVCGDHLINDITQVVKDTLNLVEKKDLGDSTQNIVYHSKSAVSKADLSSANAQGIPDKGEVSRDVSDVASQLRRVSQLMVKSPAFRSFLWEFYQLSRDSFGPQVDQVVEAKIKGQDNEHDAGAKYGQMDHSFAHQLPNSEASARPYDEPLSMHHQQTAGTAPPLPIRHAPAYPNAAYPNVEYPNVQYPNVEYSRAQNQQGMPSQFTQPGYDRHVKPSTDAIRGQEYLGLQQPTGANNMVGNKKQEELAERWNSMFDEIKQDLHIQEAVRVMKRTLIYMKDKYRPIIQDQKEKVLDTANKNTQLAENEDDLTVILSEIKGLLERFAGGKSMDPLINVVTESYTAFSNDRELSEWFEELYEYLDTSVKAPETLAVGHETPKAKLEHFISRGQVILQGRHRDLSQRFLDETNDFLYSLINDEATSRLRASVQNVIKDLFLDAEGRFVIKPDVYAQLGKALIPILSQQLSNIEVCRVDDHNEQIDFTLTNIVIDANDLKPDQFEVKNITGLSVGKETCEGAALHVEFRISAKGTTCTIRDANFYYKKHTFPKLKDSGILDASLAGNGLSFDLDVSFFADATGMKDIGHRDPASAEHKYRGRRDRRHSIFKVKDCRVDIDKLKLNFRDANHDILYKVFKPIIVSKASKEITLAIKEQLLHFVEELDKAAIQARDKTKSTLDMTGASDRILRGTKPEQLNVGHSHQSSHSSHGDNKTGQFDDGMRDSTRMKRQFDDITCDRSQMKSQTGQLDDRMRDSSHMNSQTGQLDDRMRQTGQFDDRMRDSSNMNSQTGPFNDQMYQTGQFDDRMCESDRLGNGDEKGFGKATGGVTSF